MKAKKVRKKQKSKGSRAMSYKLRTLRKMEKHASEIKRIACIRELTKMGRKQALPFLKRLLFDSEREIRKDASEALAGFVGWKKTIEFISENFKTPGDVPSAFFYDSRPIGGKRRELTRWLKRDWRPIKRQAVIDARKIVVDEKAIRLTRMRDERGKPFSIKGIPVFLGRLHPDYLASYRNGVLVVQANQKKLAPEFREAEAWHEFGEIFSHNVGIAFSLDCLKKTGKLRKYANRYSSKVRGEFRKIKKNW